MIALQFRNAAHNTNYIFGRLYEAADSLKCEV